MKIKHDFVTNSSSVGFVLAFYNDKKFDIEKYESDAAVSIYLNSNSIDGLNEYTHGNPVDWITKACGIDFTYLSEEKYSRCKEIIEKGGTIVICFVERGEESNKFDDEEYKDIISTLDG